MAQVALPFHAAINGFGQGRTLDFPNTWLLVLEQLDRQGPQPVEQLGTTLAECFSNSDTRAYLLIVALWELLERKLINAEFRPGVRRAPEFHHVWITRAGHNWLAEGLRRPEIEELLRASDSRPNRMRSSSRE